MRYALVDATGAVVNAIMLSDPAKWPVPNGCSLVPSETAGPGWKYGAGAFTAPPSAAPTPSPNAQILALEAKQDRAVREAILTGDKTRLQAIDDQIAALRAKL